MGERERVDAKNDLETWLFNQKSDLKEKYKGMEEDDKEQALDAVQDAIKWLEDNKDEVEEVIKPLIDAAKESSSDTVDEDDIDNDDEEPKLVAPHGLVVCQKFNYWPPE